jgi:hypothetical protein
MNYKYECSWSPHDGWHFSLGKKRLWEASTGYIVAEIHTWREYSEDKLKPGQKHEGYRNHEHFTELEDALNFMRTGEIPTYYIVNSRFQPLSYFASNDFVTKKQLRFRKRDCISYRNKKEALEYLAIIQSECRQKGQAQSLKVSTLCKW